MSHRIIVYAPGHLGPLESKTANGLIRFRGQDVFAVIDPSKAGKKVEQVLGYGGDIPVVATLSEALAFNPDVLAIGIAPIGGRLHHAWIPDIKKALEIGLTVWSGLHDFLVDHEDLTPFSDQIWDLRRPPSNLKVAMGTWQERHSKVLLTIGSDANIGKMTTALTLQQQLREKGLDSIFVGTGQTGMMISGRGVAIDAVIADFINGAIEREIDKVDGVAPLIIVEGQGAVTHMGYSGVTLGLIHGCMPDAFILAHQPSRKTDDYDRSLPSLNYIIELHEKLVEPFKPAPVLGVNIYSKGMELAESHQMCHETGEQLRLPVEDMLRAPTGRVAENVINKLFPEL